MYKLIFEIKILFHFWLDCILYPWFTVLNIEEYYTEF